MAAELNIMHQDEPTTLADWVVGGMDLLGDKRPTSSIVHSCDRCPTADGATSFISALVA